MSIRAAFKEAGLIWADGRAKQRLEFENRDAIATVEKLQNNYRDNFYKDKDLF